MRLRTALIGFALAGLTVAGTATAASAHSISGYHAGYASGSGSIIAGHGTVGKTYQFEDGHEAGFTAGE
ncbi:hypothetical protein OG455_35835 [Kitasatospora sp. NBC_01287]|uniref:hypothetical protein n=1 Tax=Kitasatospora sp. NBC_01287 TaxID=2903573 RepID=UPI002256BEAD|nr:hypothetical protein [Kitasatospora sp. NBC_01287]MCX4750815.1 hypothetical protein [Kitasatospora sp. NBC_01287]